MCSCRTRPKSVLQSAVSCQVPVPLKTPPLLATNDLQTDLGALLPCLGVKREHLPGLAPDDRSNDNRRWRWDIHSAMARFHVHNHGSYGCLPVSPGFSPIRSLGQGGL